MFDVYFCPRVARRLQAENEAVTLAGFLVYLHGRGHARNTIHMYVRAVELFLQWLRQCQQSLDTIDETIVLTYLKRPATPQGGWRSTGAAVRHFLRYLRSEGVVLARATAPKSAVEHSIAEYDAYLANVCGLAAATRLYRRRYAREFVQFAFGTGRKDWRCIKPEQVQGFVAQYGDDGRTAAAQVAAVSLRSFLRWLQFRGRVDVRLTAAVPHCRQCRFGTLPRVMSDTQLRSFLAAFDRSRPKGRRDYAMALCMGVLGLRAVEVASLQVDDLDAAAGTLRLSSGKVRRDRLLPMPPRVRQAVIAYMQRDRPCTDSPSLFVRHRIPVGAAVTYALIRGVMQRAYALVPGCEGWTGTHLLRHTAATRMQRAGADLKRIADILGHRSLDTTIVYTKVDHSQLAAVALPWPRGEEVCS